MRCEEHGLGCGPDGRCVLCRKSAPPRAQASRPIVLWAAAAVLVAAGAGALLFARPRATGAIEPDFHSVAEPPVVASSDEAAPAPVARIQPAPVDPNAAVDPARARELAMLRAMANGVAAQPSDSVSAAAPPPEPPPPPPAPEPATAARAEPSTASRPDVHVVVYTTSWCSVCKRAKKWMAANGVSYEERDVETSDANARRMRILNPRGGVPTFDVEGQVMVGFSEDGLLATMRQAAQHRSARSM
jgi:glutaredoxin